MIRKIVISCTFAFGLPLFVAGCASGNAEKLAVATGDTSLVYSSELKKLRGTFGDTAERRTRATAQLQGVTARSRANLDADIALHGDYGTTGARDVRAFKKFRALAVQLAKAEEDAARVRGSAEARISSNLDRLPKQDVAVRNFGTDLLALGKPPSRAERAGQLINLVETVANGIAAARKDGQKGGEAASTMAEMAAKEGVTATNAAESNTGGGAGT